MSQKKELLPIKEIEKEVQKKEPINLKTCSFTKACKELVKIVNMKPERENIRFEEKKSGDIWEIEVKITKIPTEIFTDASGKTWKRIS